MSPELTSSRPHPAPPTTFPVSAVLYTFLPLLEPKIGPSLTTFFLSHPFSNPSGNPVGSTFKIDQQSSHFSPPAFYHPVPSHRLASDFCNSLWSPCSHHPHLQRHICFRNNRHVTVSLVCSRVPSSLRVKARVLTVAYNPIFPSPRYFFRRISYSLLCFLVPLTTAS